MAQDPPEKVFKIFQFPPNKIPQIDGNADDWAIVPDSYVIGTESLHDDRGHHAKPDPSTLDVHVKVGWVKGLNRLYFLYEAYDNFWDFESPGLHNDTFELVVDGDQSGGPLIPRFRPDPAQDEWDSFFSIGSVMAQNYHIFTPAVGKDWAMAFGCEPWVKEMPYANHAASYNFKQGESGKYTMEFWITPFDYAGCDGPQRAVESKLEENRTIGISWATIVVAFRDLSEGKITSWKWDFGDGSASFEQHPLHAYKAAGQYIVVLYVEGPTGKSRMSKIYDVTLR
jgi:hypothetical protein